MRTTKPKLTKRLYKMISDAVKCSGSFDPNENMFHFEEKLTHDEYDKVYDFLEWVHINGLAFGHGNYEERFSEYLNVIG
jgi:hypothetical protein